MRQSLTILFILVCTKIGAQNVGIGTTTPTQPLTVRTGGIGITQESSDGTMQIGFYTLPGTGAFLQTHTNHPLNFTTNDGAAQATLLVNGNFGIGTTTPSKLLTVKTNNTGIAQESADGTMQIGFYTNPAIGAILQTNSNHPLNFSTNNGSPQATLLVNGNFGIGTATPGTKLEVNGQIKIAGGVPGAGKILQSDASGLASWIDKSNSFLPTGANGNTLRNNGTSWLAVSNLYNDGTNIGIGTTSPLEKLSVQTATNSVGITHSDGTIKLGTYVGGLGAGGYFGTISNHPLYFYTNNGAAQTTLLPNGNFGIGTTSPSAKLQVNGTFKLTDGTQGADRILTSDASGTAIWKSPVQKSLHVILNGSPVVPSLTPTAAPFVDNLTSCFNDFSLGSFNNATNRFTVPAGEGGTYLINVQATWALLTSLFPTEKLFYIDIRKNSERIAVYYERLTQNQVDSKSQNVSQIVQLNPGDLIHVIFNQESTVNQAVYGGVTASHLSYLNITRLY